MSTRDIVFEGQVWRVFPVPGQTRLLVECRHSAERKVSFSSISLHPAKVNGVFQDTEELWWLSVFQVTDEYLLLHGFRDAQHPEPLGVWVLKTSDAGLLWKNKLWTALSISEDKTLLVRDESGTGESFSVDLKKGSKIAGSPFTVQDAASLSTSGTPAHYSEGSESFDEVKSFLKDLYGWEVVIGLDYLEYEDRVVISFYLYENNNYTNRLLVLDAEGNTLLLETLSEGNKGIGSGTFLVHEKVLIFVRQLSTLALYDLY